MPVYKKIDGVWTPASSVALKRNGVYVPVTGAYAKRSGTWQDAYIYDVEPPPPPVLSVTIKDALTRSGTLRYRYFTVGVAVAGPHNPNVRRVRVLTTYNNAYPTSQYGGTYHAQPTNGYPGEPWSEWRYNGFGPHHSNTSTTYHKNFPINATNTTKIVAGRVYHFRAWTEDFYGNWSSHTQVALTGPKTTIDSANVVHKSGRFQITESGTRSYTSYVPGELVQQGNPLSRGLFFYGNQIADGIGRQGTPTIKSASIALHRKDDGGSATSNIYIARHNYSSVATMPPVTSNMAISEPAKLGTLSKGEGKWFALPAAYLNNLNTSIRGFALLEKDPIKAAPFAEDYSVIKGVDDYLRAGELYITWSEKL